MLYTYTRYTHIHIEHELNILLVGKLSNMFTWKGTSEQGLWQLATKAAPAAYHIPVGRAACALPLLAYYSSSNVSVLPFVSYLLSIS